MIQLFSCYETNILKFENKSLIFENEILIFENPEIANILIVKHLNLFPYIILLGNNV